MTRKSNRKKPAVTMRCAVYTRKSTEEGLDQEFNSLDAQRESAEAYIASQQNEGWGCLPDFYDDGGFTGGNMERPALHRLMADIEAGKVDCVVVYKVDRLSRSLLDFARIMEVFDRQKVAFVSVTQQFNTATSMGRLVLNVLLSFAQFEREIIGERIRDKIAAQRRKGKWTGGTPVLGYDVDRSGPSPKLVVNAEEAARVREIYQMYLRMGSMLPVVEELDRRGWLTKSWKTKSGRPKGGRPFDRGSLHALLKNPLYIGKLKHKKNLYVGEHELIVQPDVFQKVQTLLLRNRHSGSTKSRNRHGALLRRLLYCKACGHAMVHNFTGRGGKQYRYYTCTRAIKSGRSACPSAYLPAAEIEQVVVDRIRAIADDADMVAEVVRQARALAEAELNGLQAERTDLERELARHHAALRKLVADGPTDGNAIARVADLQESVTRAESRLAEVRASITDREAEQFADEDFATAFHEFDNTWNALSPREQAQTLALLLNRVEFDAADSSITMTFHPSAIISLTTDRGEEAA